MEILDLERIIKTARQDRSTSLDLRSNELFILPEDIGNLSNLTSLDLYENNLTSLPETIGNLSNLTSLYLNKNQLVTLPDSICKLSNLTSLVISSNRLTHLPEDISSLTSLKRLYLNDNQLTSLPSSMAALTSLTELYLNDNPWSDLSVLQSIPNLKRIYCFEINLPRRYWTHQSQWRSEWLLNENNAKIRTALIERFGYEKIFKDLASLTAIDLQKCLNDVGAIKLDLSDRQLATLPTEIGNIDYLTELNLEDNRLTSLPESIGSLCNLTKLSFKNNYLTSLPANIGNLINLIELDLENNQLTHLPENISSCSKLTELNLSENSLTSLPKNISNFSVTTLRLDSNQLVHLPKSICCLFNLTYLYLGNNQLKTFPKNIGNLSKLARLDLSNNQLVDLPKSIGKLDFLTFLNLHNNPWTDLSSLQNIPNLKEVYCFGVMLSRRYWTKLSEWQSEWLLDEDNAEIRRTLIAQIGYERICTELNTVTLDTWREYTLLKIDGIEKIYDDEDNEPVGTEPMVLLKMTCPSTAHIHILRVPPEMVSAEAAISWVNHGIHPDKFAVQT